MGYEIGDVVESFEFRRAGGGEARLDPASSAATIVVWTCNHCPYALAWHDRLQGVARDYASRGVTMLQINANDAEKYPADSFAEMERRVAAGEFASDYLHDPEQSVSKRWGAKVTPDVFLLDPEGRLVYRGAPDDDHEDPARGAAYLRAALDDLLSGRPIGEPETRSRGCKIKWTVDDQPNPYL